MAQDHAAAESNFLYDYPGVVATLFALAVTAVFLSSLYMSATSHHEEGGEHGAPAGEHAAPAGEHAAPGGAIAAPAGSAAAH